MERRLFAPAKINLFLEIRGRRSDGYHEIATVMATLDCGDVVEVAPATALEVHADRPDVPSGEENLAARIVRAAEKALDRALPARIRIRKQFAPGSGLGAGSSDAVAALRGVLDLHGISLQVPLLRRIAARVGSDTAFFVDGGTALCTGRGEIVEPCPCPRRWAVLALGADPVPTAQVYAQVRIPRDPRDPGPLLAALAADEPVPLELVHNRLAGAAFEAFPALALGHRELERETGRPFHLSGSGSAFFALVCDPKEGAHLLERVAGAGFEPLLASFGEPA
jgi:4-diphosphocytidyl-2-C-methyl-D-erythritol kinase